MSADVSEVRAFSASLRSLSSWLRPQARAIVERGGLNIKRQMIADLRGSRSFKGAAASVSYEMHDTASETYAEIAPAFSSSEPGALANIAYFGTSRGGGASVADPLTALRAELPEFEAQMAALLARGLAR